MLNKVIVRRLVFFTAIIIVGSLLYLLDPTKYLLMPKCPIKLWTGLSCPGCGMQRLIHALMHGEYVKAIQYNYYMLFVGPYAIGFLIKAMMFDGISKRKFENILENKFIVNTYLITFVIWFVVRNLLKL